MESASQSSNDRDLIRKDKERAEDARFERLKAELGVAFAAPDDSYSGLTEDAVIARKGT